jgi:two-component system nitrate/nitrite response regulator NarL
VDLVETLIGLHGGYRLVGSTQHAAQGIVLAEVLEPHVILLDLHLPGMDGLEALPHLRRASRAAIVVFSSFPDPYTLFSVLRRGADAYVDKAMAWAELLPAMDAVCEELGHRAKSSH